MVGDWLLVGGQWLRNTPIILGKKCIFHKKLQKNNLQLNLPNQSINESKIERVTSA